jgi:hypothetical protein
MIENSPALASRGLELRYERERALGDAIAAETGADDPQQRIAADLAFDLLEPALGRYLVRPADRGGT